MHWWCFKQACLGHTRIYARRRDWRHGPCGCHFSAQTGIYRTRWNLGCHFCIKLLLISSFLFFTDCQAEPPLAAFGRGEQRENQTWNDHVFGHCSFLAYQQLGLVSSLKQHRLLCGRGRTRTPPSPLFVSNNSRVYVCQACFVFSTVKSGHIDGMAFCLDLGLYFIVNMYL